VEESAKLSSPQQQGWYPDPEQPKTQRYWDGEKWGKQWVDPQTPGWHLTEGTLRYFDGSAWTGHVAPPSTLTTWSIAGAVCVGILAAFFIIWLGAQISPENIYLPVKFVVKELPSLR
jgi:hypothetical protein